MKGNLGGGHVVGPRSDKFYSTNTVIACAITFQYASHYFGQCNKPNFRSQNNTDYSGTFSVLMFFCKNRLATF